MKIIYQDNDYEVRTDDDAETVWVHGKGRDVGQPASLDTRPGPPTKWHMRKVPGVTTESHFLIGGQLIRSAARDVVEPLAEAARARAYARSPEACIPGYPALRQAVSDWSDYDEKFRRAIERGAVRMPRKPVSDPGALRAAYPTAAMYLSAKSQADSASWASPKASIYRALADDLLAAIREGAPMADLQAMVDKADKDWSQAAHDAVMRS